MAYDAIEGHGGVHHYILKNLLNSVISRTLGTGPNDGNTTVDDAASVFASNLAKVTDMVLAEAYLKQSLKIGVSVEKFVKNLPKNYAELTYLAIDKYQQTMALATYNELTPSTENGRKVLFQLKDVFQTKLNETNKKLQKLGVSPDTSSVGCVPRTIFDVY